MTSEAAGRIRELLLLEERTRLKEQWAQVFGGAVAVDFVCRNPDKMRVLKEAMQAADLVPLTFNIQPTERTDCVRVSIEL